MKFRNIILLVIITLSSCTLLQIKNTYEEQLEHWKSLNINHYSFFSRTSCYCARSELVLKRIEVSNDTIINVESMDTNYTNGFTLADYADFETVNELFSRISNAIDYRADSLEVEYDQTYHYPTRISIDYDQRAVDDEITYIASNLTILN